MLQLNVDSNENVLNMKRKKVGEEESGFWKEFENSNMLGVEYDNEALKTELKLFLIENKLSKEADPSDYWSLNSNKYPRISVLARKYLTSLPTSAYSERCFSLSANIITKKRTTLCPELAETLVFLHKNIELSAIVK